MSKSKISLYSELAKVRITIVVSLTTALGYIQFTGTIDSGLVLPIIGLFLLASGSAVGNHLQEKEIDSLMERTKNRPLPSGQVSVSEALIFALVLIMAGILILFFSVNLTGAALGMLALIWYNGIYTPLKSRSSLAVIPGSLIGAIPPVIGWVAGGGYYLDPQILVIAVYFFIWQIPHFWLLLLIYDNDYSRAGLPTLTRVLSRNQLERITFIWIVATVFIALAVPFINALRHPGIHLVLLAAAAWLVWMSVKIIRPDFEQKLYRKAFMNINYFTLFFILIMALDKLIS